ncbi:Peptidyl-tRNA hydrolase PTH2 [Nocardioides scoriae]|uniref:Peptidyl-tRNA hydrolase PTH2 n=1 Tax=Nocardioides scoriae TaxID=642780 RepID=A0A1H1P4W0_9ACTN|nr:Peptidyl-tRNA hydrolase PTH2 [Nocardioides scoriae]
MAPVTPYADPPEPDGVPWALQVVVRVEKDPSPAHLAVLRSVASAVALALADLTSEAAEPEERARTERWRAGPIRKVVRRARGAGWTRQLAVPGVRSHHGEVDVAVHVPGPVDDVHPEVGRLQVGGLSLEQPDEGPRDPAGRAVLVVNPHVEMTTGKAAAQVGHAAQLVLQDLPAEAAGAWLATGAPVEVVLDPVGAWGEDWDRLVARAPVVVADGGFTEVAPGTVTVVAFPPGDAPG